MQRLLLFAFLVASVSGRTLEKRILVSDASYVHTLEHKIQELTSKVDAMSTKIVENQNLKQTVQELTANITKLQSHIQRPTAPRSCPDGYVEISNSCYRIHHNLMTWPEAVTFCNAFGAHLAIENTPAERNDLRQKVIEMKSSHKSNCYWIGASDANFEGHWEWIYPKQNVSSIYWYPGQPNNGIVSDCACLYKPYGYGVVDEPCETKYNFICEIDLAV